MIRYTKNFIEDDIKYRMYRRQARQIFLGKKQTFSCECWRTEGKENCDRIAKSVSRRKSGAIWIGCTLLRPTQIKTIIAWIKKAR